MPSVPALNLKEKDGEKLDSNEDWKVLLSNEALHYQDSLQDELSHPTAKAKLQVSVGLCTRTAPSLSSASQYYAMKGACKACSNFSRILEQVSGGIISRGRPNYGRSHQSGNKRGQTNVSEVVLVEGQGTSHLCLDGPAGMPSFQKSQKQQGY